MFTVLFPTQVRCRNCQHIGKSVVNNYYRVAAVLGFVIAIPAFMGLELIPLGRVLAPVTRAFAFTGVLAAGAFFSPWAHSCEKCGSVFLRQIK